MTQIILTQEQAKLLLHSSEPVELCDPKGHVLASVPPLAEAEFIRLAKQRSKSQGPWFSTAEVLAHFESLQMTWKQEGGFDRQRMHELLDALQKGKNGCADINLGANR